MMDETLNQAPSLGTSQLDRAYEALQKAHAAGKSEDARKIAEYIRTLQPAEPEKKTAVQNPVDEVTMGLAGVPTAMLISRIASNYDIGKARELARQSKVPVPEEVIQQGQNAVIKWTNRMHTGDIGYVGGTDFAEAHRITMENKQKAAMAPQGYAWDAETQRYIPEAKAKEKQAQKQAAEKARMEAELKSKPFLERAAAKSPKTATMMSGAANVVGKGLAWPWLEKSAAGYYGGVNLAEAANRIKGGDVPGAAISAVGTVGPALTLSPNPRTRLLGLGLTGLSYGANKLYDSPVEEQPGVVDTTKSILEGFGYANGGPVQGYSDGGGTPKQRAAKFVVETGLDALKKTFTPKPTKVMRASEALGPHADKHLYVTESDRMRSTGGDLGGVGFSKFQLEDPRYAEAQATWGVASKPKASSIVNINKRFPEDKIVWSPLIGAEEQHRSNQHVYDMLTNEFSRQAGMGKLTPELREAMNKRLATWAQYAPSKLQGIDVANPEHLKEMGNTFDRRAAIAEVIGGKGVGGRKGQIFDYSGIMQEMTDPMTLGSKTHSVGTRLFSLNNDVEYRPDLHSAFPYILKGEDKGVAFSPVPKELILGDWIGQVRDFTGKEPGYMEFMRGVKNGHGKPNAFLSQELLRKLEDAGYKQGGLVALE